VDHRGLRRVYYRDREIIGHNCFSEEHVEAEFENYLGNPLASYLRHAFPLIKKLYERHYSLNVRWSLGSETIKV
jgi:hypothetical protein